MLKLAGTFTPDEELYEMATYAGELNVALFDRTMAAGVIRPDVDVADIGLILEQLAAIAFGATPERNLTLRRRCLELMLDGLRATPLRRAARPHGHRRRVRRPLGPPHLTSGTSGRLERLLELLEERLARRPLVLGRPQHRA